MNRCRLLLANLIAVLGILTLAYSEGHSVSEKHRTISFPTAWNWDDHLGDLQPDGNGSPIDRNRIAGYLRDAHYHFVLDEKPIDFADFALVDSIALSDRRSWLWNCRDTIGRNWFVLVGSGRSPFAGESQDRIWMFGEMNPENTSLQEVVVREFPEYAGLAGKKN